MKKFNWEKLGVVFNPTTYDHNRKWMQEFAQAPATLIFDDFVRVYFSCRPPRDSNGQYVSYSAYLDLDRKNLMNIINVSEEPLMKLGKLGTFDEFGTYPVTVIQHGNEYRCYYAGWTRCESVPFNVGIGMSTSIDGGKTFKRIGDGPIISYSPDEPFILSGPKIRKFNNLYYLFYIAGKRWIIVQDRPEPVYTIRLATSEDGISWKKIGKELLQTRTEENESQASPDVFFKDGKYHMFFSYRKGANYRGKAGGYRIGYAYSDNLIDWTREDSLAGIDISESGFDNEMVAYPHVFDLDGETYMMYLGNQVGRYGFGLAKLVKD
jgi:hypothetical protein